MTAVSNVEEIVAGLRRYARAVVGEPGRADAFVGRALERTVDGEGKPTDSAATRRELYRAVYGELRHAGVARGDDAVDRAVVAAGVRRLDENAKHALLLHVLERLSLDDVAAIMSLPPDAVQRCVDIAHAALRAQAPTPVLVVADDANVARSLEAAAAASGHLVVGVATTTVDAVAMAQRTPPALVLAEVEPIEASMGAAAVTAVQALTGAPALFVTDSPDALPPGLGEGSRLVLTKPLDERLLTIGMAQLELLPNPAPRPTEA